MQSWQCFMMTCVGLWCVLALVPLDRYIDVVHPFGASQQTALSICDGGVTADICLGRVRDALTVDEQ